MTSLSWTVCYEASVVVVVVHACGAVGVAGLARAPGPFDLRRFSLALFGRLAMLPLREKDSVAGVAGLGVLVDDCSPLWVWLPMPAVEMESWVGWEAVFAAADCFAAASSARFFSSSRRVKVLRQLSVSTKDPGSPCKGFSSMYSS